MGEATPAATQQSKARGQGRVPDAALSLAQNVDSGFPSSRRLDRRPRCAQQLKEPDTRGMTMTSELAEAARDPPSAAGSCSMKPVEHAWKMDGQSIGLAARALPLRPCSRCLRSRMRRASCATPGRAAAACCANRFHQPLARTSAERRRPRPDVAVGRHWGGAGRAPGTGSRAGPRTGSGERARRPAQNAAP